MHWQGTQSKKYFQNTLPIPLSILILVCKNQLCTGQREEPDHGIATQLLIYALGTPSTNPAVPSASALI